MPTRAKRIVCRETRRAASEVAVTTKAKVMTRRPYATEKADDKVWRRLVHEFFDEKSIVDKDERQRMLDDPKVHLLNGVPQKATSASVAIKWSPPPSSRPTPLVVKAAIERACLIVSNNTWSAVGTRSQVFYGHDERVLKKLRELKQSRLREGPNKEWNEDVHRMLNIMAGHLKRPDFTAPG